MIIYFGWGGRDRTCEWRYQKPLPYHLATPQSRKRLYSHFIVRLQHGKPTFSIQSSIVYITLLSDNMHEKWDNMQLLISDTQHNVLLHNNLEEFDAI